MIKKKIYKEYFRDHNDTFYDTIGVNDRDVGYTVEFDVDYILSQDFGANDVYYDDVIDWLEKLARYNHGEVIESGDRSIAYIRGLSEDDADSIECSMRSLIKEFVRDYYEPFDESYRRRIRRRR